MGSMLVIITLESIHSTKICRNVNESCIPLRYVGMHNQAQKASHCLQLVQYLLRVEA